MACAIDDLAAWPDWFNTVVEWHHSEWLRTSDWAYFPTPEVEQTLAERKKAMREHLSAPLVPKTFVAHDHLKPWGTVSIVNYTLSAKQKPSAWLTNLFVAPSFRRTGVGSSLLSYVCVWAQQNNLPQLQLYTFDAAQFYIARGWCYERKASLRGQSIDILNYPLVS